MEEVVVRTMVAAPAPIINFRSYKTKFFLVVYGKFWLYLLFVVIFFLNAGMGVCYKEDAQMLF